MHAFDAEKQNRERRSASKKTPRLLYIDPLMSATMHIRPLQEARDQTIKHKASKSSLPKNGTTRTDNIITYQEKIAFLVYKLNFHEQNMYMNFPLFNVDF